MHRHLWFLAALLPLVLGPLAPAQAAPQILALVASNEPVPLVCRNGECAAEFSAFCLQEARRSPVPGTVYQVHGGEGIRLVAETPDGGIVSLAAVPDLRVTTARTHTSVRLSVPVETLYKRGYTKVALAVGPGISLVPEAVPGDPKPQTEQDILIATGPLRHLGASIVDEAGVSVAAARLTNRLISTLPERGRASDEARDALWSDVLGTAPHTGGPASASKAFDAYEDCRARTDGSIITLRMCLGSAHDKFIGDLNNDYWDAAKFGF
jgi:hypothetical protein